VDSPSPSFAVSIALVRSQSLSSLARAEIESLILKGALSPGERLGEVEMAEKLGVSRGPVREAFRALGEQGLIEVEKNRGVFVRRISIEEADETYAVRAVLEGLAGEALARRATGEDRQTLVNFRAEMERVAGTRSLGDYAELNFQFHQFIIDRSGNRKLKDVYDGLVKVLTMFRNTTLKHGNSLEISLTEHSRIVAAICAGDPEAARRAMTEHVASSQRRMHGASL
jgi:phosphonate utilization transcriptional regulator